LARKYLAQAEEILSSTHYFSRVPETDLATIASHTRRLSFNAGQIVLLEGDDTPGLYIVERGWLKAIKSSSGGREHTLHFIGPGDLFPEVSLLAQLPNPVTAVALEDTVVWLVAATVVERVLEVYPQVAREVIHNLAGRVVALAGMVGDLALKPVETRLAQFLLAEGVDGVFVRQRWTTQSELAAHLGTVPDVLSRALRSLTEAGLIEVTRQQIRILDQAALKAQYVLD